MLKMLEKVAVGLKEKKQVSLLPLLDFMNKVDEIAFAVDPVAEKRATREALQLYHIQYVKFMRIRGKTTAQINESVDEMEKEFYALVEEYKMILGEWNY